MIIYNVRILHFDWAKWPGQNKPQVGGEDDGDDGDGVDDGDEDGLGLNWSWSSCTTS